MFATENPLKICRTLFPIKPCAAGHGLHGDVQPGDPRHLQLQQRRQPGPQLHLTRLGHTVGMPLVINCGQLTLIQPDHDV